MTRSSFAIAYTIYYVYVYINVCSRGIRARHESRLLPRPFLANYYIGLTFLRCEIWSYISSKVNYSSKGKRKAKRGNERKGGWVRERERDATCAIATRTFSLPFRELYNLRYVTSPSKIHFTIHTNIYNRYINNIADNYGETAPEYSAQLNISE